MSNCISRLCRNQNVKMAFIKNAYLSAKTTCELELFTCLAPKSFYFDNGSGGVLLNGNSGVNDVEVITANGGALVNGDATNSIVSPYFIDTFDALASTNLNNTINNSGYTRTTDNGIVIANLAGNAAMQDSNNSNDGAFLVYLDQPVINGQTTIKVTMSTDSFETSPYFLFNLDTTGGFAGWALSFLGDDLGVSVTDYNSFNPGYTSGTSHSFLTSYSYPSNTMIEFTITLNDDDITISANGNSETHTFTNRPHKTYGGIGLSFQSYNDLCLVDSILIQSEPITVSTPTAPILSDNFFNTNAGSLTTGNATTGQARTFSGAISATGQGNIYATSNPSFLGYTGLSVNNQEISMGFLISGFIQSPYLIFNASNSGNGTGWAVYYDKSTFTGYLVRMDGIGFTTTPSQTTVDTISAFVGSSGILKVLINGDSITWYVDNTSKVYTIGSRQYKSQTEVYVGFYSTNAGSQTKWIKA